MPREIDEPRHGDVLRLLRECEHGAGPDVVVLVVVAIGDAELGRGATRQPEIRGAVNGARQLFITGEADQRRPRHDAIGKDERQNGVARCTALCPLDDARQEFGRFADGDGAEVSRRCII